MTRVGVVQVHGLLVTRGGFGPVLERIRAALAPFPGLLHWARGLISRFAFVECQCARSLSIAAACMQPNFVYNHGILIFLFSFFIISWVVNVCVTDVQLKLPQVLPVFQCSVLPGMPLNVPTTEDFVEGGQA